MHLTWFEHGTGSGRRAMEYLFGRQNSAGVERAGVKVLRGDPDRLARLIDSLPFVHRYRSGSINFHLADDPSEHEMQALLDDHFSVACAGMNADQVDWCSVLHEEADGSRHMHQIFARVCLYTGRSFNPAAPGWVKWAKPLREAWNAEMGWRRPESATALLRPPAGLRNATLWKLGKDPRQLLSRWLGAQIDAGIVPDRAALISALETKVRINHVCDQYISVSFPDEPTKAFRLSGALYRFDYTQERAIALAREACAGACQGRGEPDLSLAASARARLAEIVECRAEWNRRSYKRQNADDVDLVDRLDPWIHHVLDKERPNRAIDRTRPAIDLTVDPEVQRERTSSSGAGRSAERAVAVYDGRSREIERFDSVFGALDSVVDRLQSRVGHPTKTLARDRDAPLGAMPLSHSRQAENAVRGKAPASTTASPLLVRLVNQSSEMRDVLLELAPTQKLDDNEAHRRIYAMTEALTTSYRLLLSDLCSALLSGSSTKSPPRYDNLQPEQAAELREVIASHDWHRIKRLAPALRAKAAGLTEKLPEVWCARLPITTLLRELSSAEAEVYGILDFLRSGQVVAAEVGFSGTDCRASPSEHAALHASEVQTSYSCESEKEEQPRFH